MESGFLFGVTLIDDALTPQLSQVLERCTQLASRKRLPVLWRLSDWLNRVPKADPEVLKKRRKREGVLGAVLWAVSMFLLVPSVMEGALLAFEELKALLVPGILCLAAGVWALAGKRLRWKESCFDRQARELVRQRGTVTNLESAQVEFTEEGMVLSDGTDVGAQCFEYPEFFFVAETEALLVPVCGQRAVVLQKKDLREGSMEQLRVFLQERVSYERLKTQIK